MVTNKSKKISGKPCAILESLTPEMIKGPGSDTDIDLMQFFKASVYRGEFPSLSNWRAFIAVTHVLRVTKTGMKHF